MLQIDTNKYFKNIISKDNVDKYDMINYDDDCVIFDYDNEISKRDYYDGDIKEENGNFFDLIVNDFVLKGKECLAIFNVLFEVGDMTVKYNEVEKKNGYLSVDIEIDIKSKFEGEEFVIMVSNYYSGDSVFALKMSKLGCGDELDYESDDESDDE